MVSNEVIMKCDDCKEAFGLGQLKPTTEGWFVCIDCSVRHDMQGKTE